MFMTGKHTFPAVGPSSCVSQFMYRALQHVNDIRFAPLALGLYTAVRPVRLKLVSALYYIECFVLLLYK